MMTISEAKPPASGDKQASKEWQPITVPQDDIMVFGTAEMPWLNLAKALGYAGGSSNRMYIRGEAFLYCVGEK